MPITIAIADDSADIRKVIRSCIESHTDWQVCGEADDGESAVILVERLKPDLLVLDLSMPVMNGLDAARKIRVISPETRIVLFTGHACEQLLHDVQSIGIHSVVAKDEDATLRRLVTRLREAHESRAA